ncbi:flagellin [Bradyrhizobium sp. S69]|jgi:flagellin|uniref:flagellin N-terminal helical domain-containing protein n=1 Tax=Bradyrhizobium sp. S69 TaxID=1641856 RepID=UPI00131D6B7C|nr:flagellin [Bradyrhizobium sp. S69]
MSGITLSASVRQNLLSLQSTASLLATTQNDLATGNKVNSALDNPTSYFTAQGLNNRASDINNLLDQIGNGVQVLQAANTGITSLQSLVSSAQSIANQVLQAPTGYATKSSVSSTALTGATAENLLGSATSGSVTEGAFSTLDISGSGTTTFDIAVDGAATPTAITLNAAAVTAYNTAKGTSLAAGTLSAANVASLINYSYDSQTSSTATVASVNTGGNLVFSSSTTGTSSSVAITAVSGTPTGGSTGIVAGTGTGAASALSGTLTIAATIPGTTTATNITFGTGTGNISTLNDLNTALASNDLQASISTGGVLTITTTNNASSQTVGAFGGTAVSTAGAAFSADASGGVAPVADPNSQATRASLVAQYNQVIQNITTTAQDSSFNGINLLNGDTLNLTFDETGASKLSVSGVTFGATGLGLSSLTQGKDFLDNNSANNVLTTLTQASTTLRTEASALGSNLSVVQIRQDFNKNLINVLQTGASNLTLADTNEEAADSQALSTRQSIAVSALALANSSQQSVLQLLR